MTNLTRTDDFASSPSPLLLQQNAGSGYGSKRLGDRAYEMILDALCDGTLKPGERLTQEDMSHRLNVSRQPLLHALTVLKAEGFLVQSGRHGLTVADVDPSYFEAIYQFRSVVEPLAVRLGTPRITKQAVLRGRSLIETGLNMVVAGDSRASLQVDMDFHSFLYDLSGNSLIGGTMRVYWHHLRRAMSRVLGYPSMSISVWQEHDIILAGMIRGDADGAAELMRRHVVNVLAIIGRKGAGKTALASSEF